MWSLWNELMNSVKGPDDNFGKCSCPTEHTGHHAFRMRQKNDLQEAVRLITL